MTYNNVETWNEWMDRWGQRHRSDSEIKEVDQHFFERCIDAKRSNFMTISGSWARRYWAPDFLNKQGTWIDKSNWDGWMLHSASLIGDLKGRRGPGAYQHKFLLTAWTQDDSKTVYVGLHHWGRLDQDGNKIQDGTSIKDLGYFEPTDKDMRGLIVYLTVISMVILLSMERFGQSQKAQALAQQEPRMKSSDRFTCNSKHLPDSPTTNQTLSVESIGMIHHWTMI